MAHLGKRVALAVACMASAAGVATVAAVGTTAVQAGPAGASPTVYTNTGSCVDDTYTVPAGIRGVNVVAIGAMGSNGEDGSVNGGTGSGGGGGVGTKVQATIPVTPGETLYVDVAGQWNGNVPLNALWGGGGGDTTNGGFSQTGGAGGAASWVSSTNPVSGGNCTPDATSLLAVAAGGGGGGGAGGRGDSGGGGGTEGTNGGNGADGGSNAEEDGGHGSGATSSAGGTGGAAGHGASSFYDCNNGDPGSAGTQLQGGGGGAAGSDPSVSPHCGYNYGSGGGGGGGGGYYGGGGGGGATDDDAAGGGGGAGSSYVIAGSTGYQATPALYSATAPPTGDNLISPEVSIEPVFTAPAFITNTGSITTTIGGQINVAVQASGYPLPSLRFTGNLPGNVFMNDNGDGTANIVGSPTAFEGGEYDLTLIADNHDSLGATHEATQSFKIYVDETPAIDSSTSDYWNIGTPNSFTVQTAASYPANPAITKTGTLPSGLSFVDNHNGTATISGTAATGTGGVYPLTFTAQNSAGQSTSQSFTLTVYPLPTVTTLTSTANPSAAGEPITFTATVNPHPVQSYVEFLIDGVQYAFVSTDTNGVAVAPPISSLSAGHHTITAEWQGDGVVTNSSTGTLNQSVEVVTSPASGTSLKTSAAPPSTLYFGDGATHEIYKVDGSGTHDTGYNASAAGLATDPAGDLFTFGYKPSDLAPEVLKITPQGTQTLQGSELSSISNSFGIGADAHGDAFVADNGWGQVDEETAGGNQRVLVSGFIPNEGDTTYQLSGLAVDAAGDVYFSEDAFGKVYVLPPPYTGSPQVVATGLNNPQGLAVDAAGDLFIADTGHNRIVEVPAGGSPITLTTVTQPLQLAVDAAGNLFYSSGASNNSYELAAPYTGSATLVVSNHYSGGLATTQPATSVTHLQPYSLTATVISAPAGAAPSGTVTFSEGSTVLGTASLSGTNPDTATLAVPAGTLTLGAHTVTASYGGNGAFPASVSGPVGVNVSSSDLPVDVTGTQVVGGTNLQFADTLPSTPAGVSFSGTLSGCQTSVAANAGVGPYQGTISNCGGLSLTGANAANYDITYVDSGFAVVLPTVTVDVTGALPYDGTATYQGAVVNAPSGVTGVGGTLQCSTTESNTAALGTYQGTISNCTGAYLTGANAANYSIAYSYGGITVGPGPIDVTVRGSQPYGGTPTFTFTAPGSLPSGVTGVTGTLSGCATTVTAASNVTTYHGTISGCTGLSPTGTSSGNWAVVYVDGGVTVTPVGLPVTVVGNQAYNNPPSYSFNQPTSPPAGITGVSGILSGCTTTLSRTQATGYVAPPIIDTSGCTGLTATGPNAVDYTVTYVDGGINVFPAPTGTTLSVSPSSAPDVYVSDMRNNGAPGASEVWKVSSPYTSPSTYIGNLNTPSAVATDPSGDVFVPQFSQGEVIEKTPSGTSSVVLSPANAPGLVEVWGVAVDEHGNLFVTDPFGGANGKIFELAYPYTGTATVLASGQYYPQAIAVDSADDVFFDTSPSQTFDSFIKVLPQPFTSAPSVVQDTGGFEASALTVDPAGNLYWDTSYTAGVGPIEVDKVAPPYTGTPTNVQGVATPVDPNGIALDASGNLWFADSRFYSGSLSALLWDVNGSTASSYRVGQNPTGVAVYNPPSQVAQGTQVTLTATVISGPPGSSPTGSVDFYDGGTLLGEAPLSGGATDTATFSTTALAPGSHTLTAQYVGTATYPTSVSGIGTVIVYPSTVTVPVSATQAFGGSPNFSDTVPTTAPGVSVTGTLSGCTTSVSADDGVGSYAGTITGCSGLSLSGPSASSYTLAYSDGGVTVTQAPFDIGVEATRTYGGTTTFTAVAPTLPAGVNAVTGTLTGCATSRDSTTPVGSYAGSISGCGGLTLSGPNAGDYTVAYTDDGLTVSAAPLTVTVTGSQTYGGDATFAAHHATLPSGVTLSGSLSGCATSLASSAIVGNYPNTITGCTGLALGGANGGDYALSYADGGVTVNPAPLAVTVTGSQAYGGTPTFSYSQPATLPTGITGVTGALKNCTTSEPSTAAVGTYSNTITACSSLSPTGSDASNYVVTYTDGGLTVTAAPVTVTVTGSQDFGGSAVFTATPPATLPSGVASLSGTLADCTTSVTASAPVGSYAGTISNCDGLTPAGTNGSNYVVSYADGGFTVNAATLSVPVSGTQVYGNAATFSYSQPASLPPGITDVSGTLSGCTTSADSTATVGTYTGTISGCGGLNIDGSNSSDYTIAYADIGLTVSAAPVNVTVTGTQVFEGTPTFGYTSPTLPSGITGVTGTLSDCTSTVGSTATVNSYAGTISGCDGLTLTGSNSGNYAIGYTDGGFTVTPASITQDSPTANSTTTTASSAFTDQLGATSPDGPPVAFSQTSGSSALTVSASGVVSTTGALAAGDYTATGTTTTANAAGTFAYTLTVTAVTIVQSSSTSDSVAATALPYSGQLGVSSGSVGAVTYTQSTGSAALTVSSSGAITAAGPLAQDQYTATGTMEDNYGDTGQWTFTLDVFDTDLSITSISDVHATGTAPTVPVTFTAPTALDGTTSVPVTCDHLSGSSFPIGTTKVTCSATDADDTPSTVTSSFNVIVSDSDLSITSISDVHATGTAATVPVTFTAPTALDGTTSVPVTCDHSSGAKFPIGTTLVTCSATDANDTPSRVTSTFDVIVSDSDLSITTHAAIVVNQASPSGAVVTFTKPTATDGTTGVTVRCNHTSGATYPVGVTTVTCQATDADDTPNTVSSAFTITVTSPLGQLQALLAWELAQRVPPGNSIVSKTEQAITYLQHNDTADTCTTLVGLRQLASAQSGKNITKAQATYIINAVSTITAALGCPRH